MIQPDCVPLAGAKPHSRASLHERHHQADAGARPRLHREPRSWRRQKQAQLQGRGRAYQLFDGTATMPPTRALVRHQLVARVAWTIRDRGRTRAARVPRILGGGAAEDCASPEAGEGRVRMADCRVGCATKGRLDGRHCQLP